MRKEIKPSPENIENGSIRATRIHPEVIVSTTKLHKDERYYEVEKACPTNKQDLDYETAVILRSIPFHNPLPLALYFSKDENEAQVKHANVVGMWEEMINFTGRESDWNETRLV